MFISIQDKKTLIDQGYDPPTWENYIRSVAEDFDTDYETALMIFNLLGVGEAFDGFISTMEDHQSFV